ncbi:MAG: M3 family oligoendopeptidase [Candidatus Binatia bacterium]|nr:M3 family oligoendopeptidase [Candidatus Binatia bacterium]
MTVQPNWDMTPYFASFGGAEYTAFRDHLAIDVDTLQSDVGRADAISPATHEAWTEILERLEDVFARHRHLGSYLGCLGAADARDDNVKRATAALAASRAELEKIFVRLRAVFRDTADADFDALLETERLTPIAHFLGRTRDRARFSMDADLETLAADLDVTGLSAWGRLYDQVSGTLEFDLEVPGRPTERLPVSRARSLLGNGDPDVRRAALRGANTAWESVSSTTAACLNAISGTRLTLYRRRGIEHFLSPALFDSSVSKRTLEAMLGVARERAEIPRRFLREKARRAGRERLGFQDLEAPAPGEPATRVAFDEARERIVASFDRVYPELARFAVKAFDEKWIDWEPRVGKRPGGFCSSSSVIGQSRVFMTYDGALGDVSTLAHELGHAWHSWVMRDMKPWSRVYPMTLAETASTFAEQLVIDAVLSDDAASESDKRAVLDGRLQDAAAFLLNIPMRFEFESALYEERAHGELSANRLCELMLDAQRSWYGDALAEDELDPWFWASKLHFYITGLSFYNFPYTFGYLFSLGIFARAKREGPGFLPTYEAILRSTGSAPAEKVARDHLGVDLERPDFWNESVDLIEADLCAYLG